MTDLWMPGAERQPEGNGGSMTGGKPRVVWHITWDELGKGGKMPSFDNIARYLKSVDYCPHLMWDPWTGRIVQFYPATQSARALRNLAGGVETNRQGEVCIQIETFFSPGAVVDGKKYMTVAETPCKNLDKIVSWLRSWGIPDVWPGGWPTWESDRSATAWGKAGHFGHSQVPENTHEDPGPMPRDMFGVKTPTAPKPPLAAPTWPGRVLVNKTPMMHGADVLAWQERMEARGWTVVTDGFFGDDCEKLARAFQKDKGLPVTGKVDKATWDATWKAKVT